MDKFYNDEAAVKQLTSWTGTMKGLCKGIDALPGATLDPSVMSVKTAADGFSARIMAPEADSRKEAVISIVGILKASELPPVRKMKFLRQRVTIAGFNAEVFKVAVNKVEALAFELASAFESNKCRKSLFFKWAQCHGQYQIPFDRYVDPAGILTKLQTADLAHCFENEVSYLELKNKEYIRKDPGFRQGDVVEVGVSIVKGDTYVCKLVMKTLTLLTNELTKVRFSLQLISEAEVKQNAYLKRAERELHKRLLKPSGLQDKKRTVEEVEDSSDEEIQSTRRRLEVLSFAERGCIKDPNVQ
ncbi:hypothetical protein B0H11DRAFT_1912846 [Mycena galericulata]|nr:hypothetical protein B0H11DRAFT_1912846 [Mycena galericulata]